MSKITLSARGEECQIRIPGHCNFNPETTIFCHLNGAGMGMKHKDLFGAYGCSSCHDIVDGKGPLGPDRNELYEKFWFYEAVFRTQEILIEKGLVKI